MTKPTVAFFVLSLLVASKCAAQAKPSSVETTYGKCSPNMSHNAGTVTINCTGLDPAVATEIAEVVKQLSLLNRKTATEKNQIVILKELHEIRASLQAQLDKPDVQINAQVVQSSSGNCSPNIVGNNNTNVCGPQDLNIDSQQSDDLVRSLLALPPDIPRVKVRVMIEVQSRRTTLAGEVLVNALKQAGLDVEFGEIVFLADTRNVYGGITINDVTPESLPFTYAIAKLLGQLGIVSGPIPTFLAKPGASTRTGLTIYMRKPQE